MQMMGKPYLALLGNTLRQPSSAPGSFLVGLARFHRHSRSLSFVTLALGIATHSRRLFSPPPCNCRFFGGRLCFRVACDRRCCRSSLSVCPEDHRKSGFRVLVALSLWLFVQTAKKRVTGLTSITHTDEAKGSRFLLVSSPESTLYSFVAFHLLCYASFVNPLRSERGWIVSGDMEVYLHRRMRLRRRRSVSDGGGPSYSSRHVRLPRSDDDRTQKLP